MKHILIAGIGGVGGYFGGLLAKHYDASQAIHVYFFARGEHLKKMRADGLRVIKGEEQWLAIPRMCTDKAEDLPTIDLLLLCTKSYDLEEVLVQVQDCITDRTIILPLLNGVEHREQIKKRYPNNLVLDGCVYIVSRLTQPGQVENFGKKESLFFGGDAADHGELKEYERIFREAGIEATYSENISTIIWEKYIFLSAIATATCYYNQSIGEILSAESSRNMVQNLIQEVVQLASAKKIVLPPDIIEKTWKRLESLPYETTTSMHDDFKAKKKQTELSSLCTYIIEASKQYELMSPTFVKCEQKLKGEL